MTDAESSKISIFAALAAIIAIGIAKFVGVAISGRSAMLSGESAFEAVRESIKTIVKSDEAVSRWPPQLPCIWGRGM